MNFGMGAMKKLRYIATRLDADPDPDSGFWTLKAEIL